MWNGIQNGIHFLTLQKVVNSCYSAFCVHALFLGSRKKQKSNC